MQEYTHFQWLVRPSGETGIFSFEKVLSAVWLKNKGLTDCRNLLVHPVRIWGGYASGRDHQRNFYKSTGTIDGRAMPGNPSFEAGFQFLPEEDLSAIPCLS